MFQSPSVRLYTSENTESMVQRKPGNLLARKPFVDRSVNYNTPDVKLQKSKLNVPKLTTVEVPKLSPKLNEDVNGEEFTYSFKDMPDPDETPDYLGTENIIKILRNYCHMEDTPPPSPEPAQIELCREFMELPALEMSFKLCDMLHESFNVELPSLDSSDFDDSFDLLHKDFFVPN